MHKGIIKYKHQGDPKPIYKIIYNPVRISTLSPKSSM